MLPLDGLRLNASKPEPSLETYVISQAHGVYRAKNSFGEWLQLKFTTRLQCFQPGLYESEWCGGRNTSRRLVAPRV